LRFNFAVNARAVWFVMRARGRPLWLDWTVNQAQATGAVPVYVPSPLAGEGISAVQQYQ